MELGEPSIGDEKAYLRGRLQGSWNADGAPALPKRYAGTAKTVAERQAVIAGCRLAEEIKTYLKADGR
jgi:hypothetical protein